MTKRSDAKQAGIERRQQEWREMSAAKRAAGVYMPTRTKVTDEDLAARLAEIPPDTRDLTARIFGDPIPGRRELDMRGGR